MKPDAPATRGPARPGAPDGALLIATLLLCGAGLVAVFSATAPLAWEKTLPPHFVRHAATLFFGGAVAALFMHLPLGVVRRAALPLWAGAVGLLVATLAIGVSVHDARRWLEIPGLGLRFQPGELAKWATLLAVAAWLARVDPARLRRAREWLPLAVLAGLPALLLWQQPDTGNALLLLALVGLLTFVAGAPLRVLAIPAGLGALALAAAMATRPYVLNRVRAFLDPWGHAQSEGFQLVQSFVAFGRGGAFGVGLGDGRQKLFYLPEAHTDFVLSVIAEELGLLGVAVVLGAFAALVVAGSRIAARARDRFTLLVVVGMTAFVAVPAALNAAVATGLVPPKGLTLPFVSYGRTSLVVCFAALGLLLGAGRREAGARPRPARAAERRRGWRG